MVRSSILLLLTVTYYNGVVSIPQHHTVKRSLADSKHVTTQTFQHVAEKVVPIVPLQSLVIHPITRKKKGPSLPLSITHQIFVPNLHVIPLSSVQVRQHAGAPTIISHTVSHSSANVTHQHLVPVLIPIHSHLVPVHDLTVIPLHTVVHKDTKIGFKLSDSHGGDESMNNYRNPLGGYGAGWYYGGHGAGHGFHYAYI